MLEALLFDLDGTLTDSDTIHEVAWRETLATFGVPMPHDLYRREVSGRANILIAADFLPALSHDEHLRVVEGKEARYRELAARLERHTGLDRLLDWARARPLALALVTNAPLDGADHSLGALGLADAFVVRVHGGDAETDKPDPAPYLLALERLGLAPGAGLAFEDSPAGVRAAAGAGLEVVGVTTSHGGGSLREAGASLAVPDFDDAALWARLDALRGSA